MLERCRKHGARLLIAKLDRLARNVHFISGLMESKVKFGAADMPEATELTIHIMAAFAEHEARRIGERTRDALAAAKVRSIVLGATGPGTSSGTSKPARRLLMRLPGHFRAFWAGSAPPACHSERW